MNSYAHRARQRRQFIVGASIIAVVAIVAVALAFGVWSIYKSHVELDPLTDCPMDGPRSITVLVVDRTDPVGETTALDMRQVLDEEAASVPRYGALYLFGIDGIQASTPKPIFMHCNPGSGEEVDALKESRRRVDQSFRKSFRQPLDSALNALQASAQADRSPIVEALQTVGVRAFGGAATRDVPKRLVVVSDFMQHSDRLTFYGSDPVTVLDGATAEELAAPLEDVDVRMVFIRRDGDPTLRTDALRKAWTRYFNKSGAGEIVATKLTGTDQ